MVGGTLQKDDWDTVPRPEDTQGGCMGVLSVWWRQQMATGSMWAQGTLAKA